MMNKQRPSLSGWFFVFFNVGVLFSFYGYLVVWEIMCIFVE